MSNCVYSISTDVVKPENERDARCAPSVNFEAGSCIRLEILSLFAKAYNEEYPKNQIKLDSTMEIMHPHKYKKYLVGEFNKRLEEKCTTQRCWTKQSFIRRMPEFAKEELLKFTFRPNGPDEGTEWLNTDNINQTLRQYEKKYNDFKFLGAVPRDFQNHTETAVTDEMLREYVENGKTRLGIVFNTDPIGKPGEHWNALYCDVEKGDIRFFDSYGVPANKEVVSFMKMLGKFIKNRNDSIANVNRNKTNFMVKITADYNKIRAQRKGWDCGVYATNFILRMLRGDSFEKICESKIHDDVINKCRKIYFSGDTNE
ncbi:putative thiol protease [Bodo saltans virus]|uniref:Thiol protease n=1 Tax=Bodo saltans virus TaxID=2024608 RepID=A0A2H4UUP2_9VIRU|nr:putative thiol protease [Bodo saltans virus]ATZ80653.1 putative thiol protease [Bodo saltans virus]